MASGVFGPVIEVRSNVGQAESQLDATSVMATGIADVGRFEASEKLRRLAQLLDQYEERLSHVFDDIIDEV